jgi:hypothetical protein
MTSMTKRLDVLEKANPAAPVPRVIRLVSCDEGETTEAAIARWCAEHPDQPAPAAEDVIILRAIVSPRAGNIASEKGT